jgi:hypothetical protein
MNAIHVKAGLICIALTFVHCCLSAAPYQRYHAEGVPEYYSAYTNHLCLVISIGRGSVDGDIFETALFERPLNWGIVGDKVIGSNVACVVPKDVSKWCAVQIYDEWGRMADKSVAKTLLEQTLDSREIVLGKRDYVASEVSRRGILDKYLMHPSEYIKISRPGTYYVKIYAKVWVKEVGAGKAETVYFPPVVIRYEIGERQVDEGLVQQGKRHRDIIYGVIVIMLVCMLFVRRKMVRPE